MYIHVCTMYQHLMLLMVNHPALKSASFNPFSPPLSIERIHFQFKCCWVVTGTFPFHKYILEADSEEPYQTPENAASDLVLYCLPINHKQDAGLKWVNQTMHYKVQEWLYTKQLSSKPN